MTLRKRKTKKTNLTSTERKKARIIFKRLKAGLTTYEKLSEEELELLKKYYPFLFS